MENKDFVMIKVDNIYQHPDNPRKEIGDVTELADSIKKNGVMQNLTVIPISALDTPPDEQPDPDKILPISDFYVLIGHRRLEASKKAGLSEVPCKIISHISKKEQVAIMLEENMQREDLTVWEQAQGFQMMLDLGDTEETIADKTGFSKTTVRHRINLAKLDQDELKEKEQDDSFQLTLKDLYELEKIEDVEVRNKILREANNSRDIVWKAQSAVKDIERKKKTDQIVEILKELGVKKAPKEYEKQRYSGKWETVKEFSLEKDVPKNIKLKTDDDEPLFYYSYWREVLVVKKAKKKERELTPEELKRKEINQNKKKIQGMMDKIDAQRKEFVLNIVSGKIDDVKDDSLKDAIWCVLLLTQGYLYLSDLRKFFTGKSSWDLTEEELAESTEKINSLTIIQQMLIFMSISMDKGEIYDYNGFYKEEIGQGLLDGYKVLEQYGWSFESDEEKQILDGTHPLYTKSQD